MVRLEKGRFVKSEEMVFLEKFLERGMLATITSRKDLRKFAKLVNYPLKPIIIASS